MNSARSLPAGVRLESALCRHRPIRRLRRSSPPAARPRLTISKILAWADQHRKRTGDWPTQKSGRIAGADAETWGAVNHALYSGRRGLPAGSSLAKLLRERRGRPHQHFLPPLRVGQILVWADEHHGRTGDWPRADSGLVA